MKTVYLDVLFAINAAVDYLLLRSTAHILVCPVRQKRLLTAAAVGGMLAVLLFLAGLPSWSTPVSGGIMALLLCSIAFTVSSRQQFLARCALFYGLSCLYAGLMTSFLQLPRMGRQAFQLPGDIGYIKLPLMVFLLSALSLYLLSGLFSTLPAARQSMSQAKLTISIGESHCTLSAMRDSGHFLRDPISSRGAAVVHWDAVRESFPPSLRTVLDRTLSDPTLALSELGASGLASGFSLLPCQTIQGSGLLLSYLPRSASIDGRPVGLTLALTRHPISRTGACQAIISARESFY